MVKFKRKETTQTILLVFSSFTVGIRRGLVCFWSMPTFKKLGTGQQPMFYLFFLLFILQYAIGFPHDATRVRKIWTRLVGFRQDTPCGNITQGNKIHTFFSSSSSFFNMKILPASNHSVLS